MPPVGKSCELTEKARGILVVCDGVHQSVNEGVNTCRARVKLLLFHNDVSV